jgi:hypothetical protein
MTQNEFTPPNEGEIIAVVRYTNFVEGLYRFINNPSGGMAHHVIVWLISFCPIVVTFICGINPKSALSLMAVLLGPFLCFLLMTAHIYLIYRRNNYKFYRYLIGSITDDGVSISADVFKFEMSIKEDIIIFPMGFHWETAKSVGCEYILIEKYRGKNARELMKFLTENLKKPEVNEDELNLFVWP